MSVEEVVMQKLRELPPERQREVLDFVEFLEGRAQKFASGVSALELAGNLIGSVEGGSGPGDLATNPEHLNGYGRD